METLTGVDHRKFTIVNKQRERREKQNCHGLIIFGINLQGWHLFKVTRESRFKSPNSELGSNPNLSLGSQHSHYHHINTPTFPTKPWAISPRQPELKVLKSLDKQHYLKYRKWLQVSQGSQPSVGCQGHLYLEKDSLRHCWDTVPLLLPVANHHTLGKLCWV